MLKARQLLAGSLDSLGTEFWLAFELNNSPQAEGQGAPSTKTLSFSAKVRPRSGLRSPG